MISILSLVAPSAVVRLSISSAPIADEGLELVIKIVLVGSCADHVALLQQTA